MRSKLTVAMLATVVLGLATRAAMAVPYASAVTNLGGGDYSFVLNEDADNVYIERIGDTPLLLGPLTKGTHTFNIGSGIGFKILVSDSELADWAQISDDNDTTCQFYSPKGVAVNRNTASQYFGWTYVTEGYGGPTAAGRVTTDGLYIMTADQADVTGQGDTAYDGGVDWATGGGNSPFKVTVAPDDYVYITDWSDGHSGVWRAPPDGQGDWEKLLADENPQGGGLFDNHGSIPSVWIEGTGADTVMYSLDEDYDAGSTTGSILRYDIGTATEYAGLPVEQVGDGTNIILNLRADLVRDESGDWWIAQYRWTESVGCPSLMRFEDGSMSGPVYNSAADPGLPLLMADYGNLDIHNALDMIVMGARSWYGVYILDISDPDNLVLLETLPQSGYAQDVAFDAAGNVHVVSNSSETLRIWSPGGDWLAITGPEGAFSTFTVPVEINLDLKPGSCPNSFNPGSHGVLPAALLGTADFQVTLVDLATVSLSRADAVGGQVAPNEGPPGPHSVFDDVGTPFYGVGCECHEAEGDGIVDLAMKFRTDDVVEILELDSVPGGSFVPLVITGNLVDGTPFVSQVDCLRLVPPEEMQPFNLAAGSNVPGAYLEATPLDNHLDSDGFALFYRSYPAGSPVTLAAPPTQLGRPFVGWKVNGVMQTRGDRVIELTTSNVAIGAKAVYGRQQRRPIEAGQREAPGAVPLQP